MSKYSELEKKYDELEERHYQHVFDSATEYVRLSRKNMWQEKKFDELKNKYNDLVANRFEHEYRNRPSTRCNCYIPPKRDETIWETMYGSGMAAERIAHWNTSNWECIMNSIANIHCCCMRCEKEQDDD